MDNSIYVALSKQVAAKRHLNVIANNIANANTAGFKGESMVFNDYLVRDVQDDTAFVNDISTVHNFTQGPAEVTENQLDFTINGQGFFAVQTPEGERYTRSGNFMIDTEGALSTQHGYKVLDDAGALIEFEEDDQQIVVYADGRMEVDGEERGNLGLFQFENQQKLQRLPGGLFASDELAIPNNPESEDAATIAQGVLEKSNVQSVIEVTNLIEVQRDFISAAKFINDLYELQDNAVRTISRQA